MMDAYVNGVVAILHHPPSTIQSNNAQRTCRYHTAQLLVPMALLTPWSYMVHPPTLYLVGSVSEGCRSERNSVGQF